MRMNTKSGFDFQWERTHALEGSWLVVRDLPEEETFEEDMIAHNVIPGILPMITTRLDGTKQRRYLIDGCCSLRESLLGQKLSGQEFRNLMNQLFARIAEGRRYLLREESFVVRPDTIFVRLDTGEPELIYCPEYECPLPDQMRSLSDWLLEYLDAGDAEAVYSGYAFHVMSHEEGNTMQRMIGMLSGEESPGDVLRIPQYQVAEESRDMRGGDNARYRSPDVRNTVSAGVIAADDLGSSVTAAGPQKKKGLRGFFSFLSGLSVFCGFVGILVWMIG